MCGMDEAPTFINCYIVEKPGNGALPIIGDPDYVAALMKRLSECEISALAIGFTNYLNEFPYFRDEVLPRLARKGLRTS